MTNLKVEKIKGNDYKVTGEGIEAEVYYSSRNYNKVSGKGSRKFKNEILEAIENYNRQEVINYRNKREEEKQAKRLEMLNSDVYRNIDLLSLYDVTVSYYDSYYGHWSIYNKLLTGYELMQEEDAVNAEKVSIENTDIYSINSHSQSHYERQAVADERIVLMEIGMSKGVYITGLTLKEMLLDGFKSYGNLRLAQDVELRMVQQKGLTCSRFQNEMKRAIEVVEEPKQKLLFTNDGNEIKYAWFSSKVFSLDGIRNKEMATYDRYVIEKTITVDNNTFEKFGETFEVSDLDVEFKGGTGSTYEVERQVDDYFELTEYEQANYTKNSYRECLEVVNTETGETLLIDPQGYNYGRYVAIKEDNNSEQGKLLAENDTEKISGLVNENIVYNSVSQESLGINLQHFSTSTTIDDVLSAFDDVDMSENSVITDEDRKHCENMEREYKAAIKIMNDHIEEYRKVIEMQQFEFVDSHRNIYPIEDAIKNLNDKFIYRVCEYFIKKYDVKIDKYGLVEKYKNGIELETLLNEILEQLDGLTFTELQDKQIKDAVKDDVNYSKVKLKGCSVTIGSFVYLDSIFSDRLSYNSIDKMSNLIKGIEHYNGDKFETLRELSDAITPIQGHKVFTTHEINLPKTRSIKLFKNGRVDIHFTSSEYANEFYIDYLQKQ